MEPRTHPGSRPRAPSALRLLLLGRGRAAVDHPGAEEVGAQDRGDRQHEHPQEHEQAETQDGYRQLAHVAAPFGWGPSATAGMEGGVGTTGGDPVTVGETDGIRRLAVDERAVGRAEVSQVRDESGAVLGDPHLAVSP